MIARRLGLSVVLIERGKHPRVVIGESSTPLTNLLLEELSDRYDLASVRPLAKWGSWQREHPEIACGLKRGFTFYHHDLHQGPDPRMAQPERRPLSARASEPCALSPEPCTLVTAHANSSSRPALTTKFPTPTGIVPTSIISWCVKRKSSAWIISMRRTLPASANPTEKCSSCGTRHGRDLSISAKFVVDASGPRGFLHRALGLGEMELPGFPQTQALYSHFENVGRIEDLQPMPDGQPPYPVDDAAVHHVFDGGWIWVLRFNNGITSAGVAATDEFAEKYSFSEGADAWQRILERIPVLESQFATAKPVLPFTHIPRLAFRSAEIAGQRWALLPSAAGFVDPLLSTGFPLTLLGIARLAQIFESDWNSPRLETSLAEYAAETDADLRRHCPPRRGALREHEQLSRLRVPVAALLCRRQLFRSCTQAGQAASRVILPACATILSSDQPACASSTVPGSRSRKRNRRPFPAKSLRPSSPSTSPDSATPPVGTGIPSIPTTCCSPPPSSTPPKAR